jgi:allophanate hydrolase subunit 1
LKDNYYDTAVNDVREQQVKSIIPDAVFGYDELTVNYSDVHTLKIASLEKRVEELELRLKSTI